MNERTKKQLSITDAFKTGIQFPIQMESAECKRYRETHPTCRGCISENACKEYVNRFGEFVTAELKEQGELPESFEWE